MRINQINSVGVIGAGTMGNGIAQICALAGMQVVLLDISKEAIARGIRALTNSLDRSVKKGTLNELEREQAIQRISGTLEYEDLAGVDLVIEAATENQALKVQILKKIAEAVGPDVTIATNTSSISITALAAAIPHQARFIGMHFFNPVPVMTLLELIRGIQTSNETHAAAQEFAARVGKQSITARNSPGFAVNRILVPMINEAIFVLQEGLATAEDIDLGMTLGCNQPIGPLALADLIGLDTLLAVMQVFYEGFNDPKYRPAPLLKELVAAGRTGRKTGHGFFQYG